MTKPILAIAAFGAAAVLVGCGGNKVDQLYDALQGVGEEGCKCEALSMMTEAMCVAALEAELPTEAELDCLHAAYDRHADEVDAAADCQIDAAKDEKSCFERAACNPVALQACLDAYDAQNAACPDTPSAVDAEFAVCLGG